LGGAGQGVQGSDKKEHLRAVGKGLLVQHMHNWNPRRNRQNGAEEIFGEKKTSKHIIQSTENQSLKK